MRRLVLGGLVLVLLSGVAFAATWGTYKGLPIVRLMIDGQVVQGDVPPVILDGRALVPLRLVSEALGATVAWDQATQTVTVESVAAEVPYASWQLTVGETLDAIAWARACKTVTRGQILPSYYAQVSGVGIELLTPWACVAATAYDEITTGRSSTVEGLRSGYSDRLDVWVIANPLSSPAVEIAQGNQTWQPNYVYPAQATGQEFSFATFGLSKFLPLTVTVTMNGQHYAHVWNLADLK